MVVEQEDMMRLTCEEEQEDQEESWRMHTDGEGEIAQMRK